MTWKDYVTYIFPNEFVLQFIIYCIFIFAAITLVVCVWLGYRAYINLNLLREDNENGLLNVSLLEASLRQNQYMQIDAFDSYTESKNVTVVTKPLFDHLRAIYDAGRKSSRLDADLLVQNTINKVFAGSDSVKTFISLFLVLGILGTLLGLAISIGSFSGEGFVLNAESNKTASELSKLFANLRGAFAPSMWGVFTTIIFVTIYTVGIQELCINKLTKQLTTVTINKWLPALYPTDFQKGEISMAKLNDAVKNANETAQTHVQFGDKAKELLDNLSSTNEAIKALHNIATVLDKSSVRYESGSVKLEDMSETLTGISKELEQNNDLFKTYINNQIAEIRKLQNSYVTTSDAIHKSLADSIKEYRETTSELKTIKEEVVEAVGEPITNKLIDVNNGLEDIAKHIGRFNEPMHESVTDIHNLFTTAVIKIRESNEQLVTTLSNLAPNGGNGVQVSGLVSNRNNGDSGEVLGKIANCLEEIQKQNKNQKPVLNEQQDFSAYANIGIAVLLLISIAIQGFIAYKLTTLEQIPPTVNNVVIKGEKAGQ